MNFASNPHQNLTKAIKRFTRQSHGILVLTGMNFDAKTSLARSIEKEFKKSKRKGLFLSSSAVENSSGGFTDGDTSWSFSSFEKLEYLIIDANIGKLDDIETILPTLARLIPEFSQTKLIVITAKPQRLVNDPPFYHEIFDSSKVSEIKILENFSTPNSFKKSLFETMKIIASTDVNNTKEAPYRIIHNYVEE